MKILLSIIATLNLCALSFGEVTSEQIQGYWKFEHGDEEFRISTITSYLPNGIYTDEGLVIINLGNGEKKIPYATLGRWSVEEGVLVIVIEESSSPVIRKGMEIRSKLISAKNKKMVFESELDKKRYTATRTTRPNPDGTADTDKKPSRVERDATLNQQGEK